MADHTTPKLPDQTKAEYDGREVTLYDPFRIDDDEKKFAVYVENPDSGNINKLKFGSAEMEIQRDDEENLKSFRARMQCDDVGQSDKHTARFWSCVFWRSDKSVTDLLSEEDIKDVWYLQEAIEKHTEPKSASLINEKIKKFFIEEVKMLLEQDELEEARLGDVIDKDGMIIVTPQSPQYDRVQREVRAERGASEFNPSSYPFYVVNTKTYSQQESFTEVWGGLTGTQLERRQFGIGYDMIEDDNKIIRLV